MTRNRIFAGRKPVEMSARPWSKLIDRKFLNMNTASIELLLKLVHFPLIKKYEENVLHKNGEKRTLSQINEEYKKGVTWIKRKRGLDIFLFTILLVISVTSFFREKETALQVLIFTCICVSIVAFSLYTTKKDAARKMKVSALQEHLERFRKTLEAIRYPSGLIPDVYSEPSIKEVLLTWVMQILSAEKHLDEVRMQKRRDLVSLKYYCDQIEQGQIRLSDASDAAEQFGVTVNKAELFKTAQDHLSDQFIKQERS